MIPQAYESGPQKPEAIKNALVNLYVVRRAARIAVDEGLLTNEEVVYRRLDGGYRVALDCVCGGSSGPRISCYRLGSAR